MFLNGRRIGRNVDPYTPFTLEARGLRPGRPNELVVIVDGRKNPDLPEAWWNWNGIVRPGDAGAGGARAHRGPRHDVARELPRARRAAAGPSCSSTGCSSGAGARAIAPSLDVKLRSPSGRVTSQRFRLPPQRSKQRRLQLSMRVPAPELWSPDAPRLYAADITLRERGRVVQRERRRIGLRSVEVKRGHLWLNNRRIQLRGASIHEDMPGSGAALTGADMDRIVADLQDLGANVTRAHYLLNDRLLEPARPRRDPRLEPGADLAARHRGRTCSGGRRSASARSSACAARSRPRAATPRCSRTRWRTS